MKRYLFFSIFLLSFLSEGLAQWPRFFFSQLPANDTIGVIPVGTTFRAVDGLYDMAFTDSLRWVGGLQAYGTQVFFDYGTGVKEAVDLSETLADYVFRPSTNGYLLEQTLANFANDVGSLIDVNFAEDNLTADASRTHTFAGNNLDIDFTTGIFDMTATNASVTSNLNIVSTLAKLTSNNATKSTAVEVSPTNITFRLNGSAKVRILENSNVGLGLATPDYPLHVKHNQVSGFGAVFQSDNNSSYFQFFNNVTGLSSIDGALIGINAFDAYLFNREAGRVFLGTQNTARLTVESAGHTRFNPYGQLNQEAADLSLTLGNPAYLATNGTLLDISVADFASEIASATNYWTLNGSALNYTTGHVSVGTTNATHPFYVRGAEPGTFIISAIEGTGNYGYLQIWNSDTGIGSETNGMTVGMVSKDAFVINKEVGFLQLGTSSASRIHIDSSGVIQFNIYGLGNNTAATLSKTLGNPAYLASDGTLLDISVGDFAAEISYWTALGDPVFGDITRLFGDVGIGTSTPNLTSAGLAFTIANTGIAALELATTATDADNVTIGSIRPWFDANSASHDQVAAIDFLTDGGTANQRGGEIILKTKPNGSTTLTNRVYIDQDGKVGIGQAATANIAMVLTRTTTSSSNQTALDINPSNIGDAGVTGIDVNAGVISSVTATNDLIQVKATGGASGTLDETIFFLAASSNHSTATAQNRIVSFLAEDHGSMGSSGATPYAFYNEGASDQNYFAGSVEMNRSVKHSGRITPGALGANTDNWNPTDFHNVTYVSMSASTPVNITGFDAGVEGEMKTLYNSGNNAITLVHQSTSSAANQISHASSSNHSIPTHGVAMIRYDATSSKWIVISTTE